MQGWTNLDKGIKKFGWRRVARYKCPTGHMEEVENLGMVYEPMDTLSLQAGSQGQVIPTSSHHRGPELGPLFGHPSHSSWFSGMVYEPMTETLSRLIAGFCINLRGAFTCLFVLHGSLSHGSLKSYCVAAD